MPTSRPRIGTNAFRIYNPFMRSKAAVLILCFLLSACTFGQKIDARIQAQESLDQFLACLAEGEYSRAAELYGGSYENLQSMNPSIAADDYSALWKNGCQLNGIQCLPLLNVVEAQETKAGEFLFIVELQAASGETYERGVCCGSEDDQTTSLFDFRVVRSNGNYLVMDMPPYVP
jgi:hypothetical protein